MPAVQAVIFDLYLTLIDIRTNEGKDEVWDTLSMFAAYHGRDIGAGHFKREYESAVEHHLRESPEKHPEVDLKAVFAKILSVKPPMQEFLPEAFCKLFRVLSRERFGLFPETFPVLNAIREAGLPMALVSNAQRVFTLDEMRMLGLVDYFKAVVFSSDYGFQKPDARLFSMACTSIGVDPKSAVYVGDNPDVDPGGPIELGMKAIILNRQGNNSTSHGKPYVSVRDLREAWDKIRQG